MKNLFLLLGLYLFSHCTTKSKHLNNLNEENYITFTHIQEQVDSISETIYYVPSLKPLSIKEKELLPKILDSMKVEFKIDSFKSILISKFHIMDSSSLYMIDCELRKRATNALFD
jgi:hypothetical protein